MPTRHAQARFHVVGDAILLRWDEVDTLFESKEGILRASVHLRRSIGERRLSYTLLLHLVSSDPFFECGIESVEADLTSVSGFISSAYFDFAQKAKKLRQANVVGNLLRDLVRQWTAFPPTLLEEEHEFRELEQQNFGH